MSVKRVNRIKKDRDFKRIIDKKRVVKNDVFVIYYDYPNCDVTRVGVSVAKKTGGAVKRNRIRRQIKAMASDILSFKENIEIIIIARKEYNETQYHDNQRKLKELIKQIKLT